MSVGSWIMVLGAIGMGRAAATPGERIVLCKDPAGICRQGTVLGKSTHGIWAQVADDAVLAAHPVPRVLYFSVPEYQDAMSGLSDKERAQAILRRDEVVAGNLSGCLFAQLTRDLKDSAPGATRADLDALIEAAAVLDGGSERLRGSGAGELLDMASADLAQLVVELPKGPLVEAFAKQAEAVGRLATGLRKDGSRSPLPFAEPRAVFFIPSLPEKELLVLRALAGYPHAWHGGVVAIVDRHQLAQAPFKGRALEQLYPGPADYLADLTELTAAQLDRRLATRLRSGFDRNGFVAELAFRHAILCRALTTLAQKSRMPWATEWQAIDAMDVDNLQRVLAATRPTATSEREPRVDRARGDFALAAGLLRDGDARHRAMLVKATDALSKLALGKGWPRTDP